MTDQRFNSVKLKHLSKRGFVFFNMENIDEQTLKIEMINFNRATTRIREFIEFTIASEELKKFYNFDNKQILTKFDQEDK